MKRAKGIYLSVLCSICLFCSCSDNQSADEAQAKKDSAHYCINVPNRFAGNPDSNSIIFSGDTSLTGMVLIPGGIFDMGGDNPVQPG